MKDNEVQRRLEERERKRLEEIANRKQQNKEKECKKQQNIAYENYQK